MSEVTILPEINLELVNAQVAAGLARVKEVKEKTAELKEKSATVTISGDDDKAGYALTKAFLGEVRPIRTSLEKERVLCVSPFNKVVEIINAEYKNAMSELVSIEFPHKEQKEKYEAALEKRKNDELEAAEKMITDKINLLCTNGLEYDAINGYYKNDTGLAVNRMNIINLSDEDFDRLLDRVKARKEELDAIQKESEQKEAEFEHRKRLVLQDGMKMDLTGLSMMHYEIGSPFTLTFDELRELSPEKFSRLLDQVIQISEENDRYHTRIKAAADKTLADQLELEKQQEKLKLDKVSVFKDKLEGIGFKFIQGASLEGSRLSFTNKAGFITVFVGDLLANEFKLDATIADCEDLKNQQTENEQFEIERAAEAEKKAEETRKLEAQKALNTEARKKKMSRTDLAKIDPLTSELIAVIEKIKATNFELIGNRTLALTEAIELEINRFNISVNHLRNN